MEGVGHGTGDGSLSQYLLVQKQPIRPIFDVIIIEKQASIKSLIPKHPEGKPSGCRKAFPAHGEGGPLAVDEVPAKRIMDSIVPGQVGQKVRPLVLEDTHSGIPKNTKIYIFMTDRTLYQRIDNINCERQIQ